MRKHYIAAMAGMFLVFAGGVHAQEKSPVSANVALTSDYVFRGISQTQEEAALQGGFDYAHQSGFYAGVWGSNVNFAESAALVAPAKRAQLELDLYGGYGGKIGEKASWDVGLLHYAYPGAGSRLNYDYTEIYGKIGLTIGKHSLEFALNHTSEFFADSGKATYFAVNLEVPLPSDFTFTAHVAKQEIDKEPIFGTPDYTDYKVGISKKVKGIGLALDLYDTDLSKSECFGGAKLCDSRAVFTISKSF